MYPDADRASVTGTLFVIGGFNGLASVQDWVTLLQRDSSYFVYVYSWRQAQLAKHDIANLPQKKRLTLIGHSLGGGCAQLLSQQLPAGTIDTLITVAPYGPETIDHDLTRRNVGHWLNIVPTSRRRGWRDFARNIAAPLLLNWKEQGLISSASENHLSEFPHHDFYKLITDRCGTAERGFPRLSSTLRVDDTA